MTGNPWKRQGNAGSRGGQVWAAGGRPGGRTAGRPGGRVGAVCLAILVGWSAGWVLAAERSRQADSGGARPEAPPEGPIAEIREGYVVNFAHRYYFPAGEGWALSGTPEADFLELRHTSLDSVFVRILVLPGNTLPLDETVQLLREKAAGDGASILDERRLRVGLKEAASLLSLKPARSGSQLLLGRTVTFNRGADKYSLRLESPPAGFERANADFEAAVQKLRWSR